MKKKNYPAIHLFYFIWFFFLYFMLPQNPSFSLFLSKPKLIILKFFLRYLDNIDEKETQQKANQRIMYSASLLPPRLIISPWIIILIFFYPDRIPYILTQINQLRRERKEEKKSNTEMHSSINPDDSLQKIFFIF